MRLADPARFDLRGRLECGQDVEIDVNCVFQGRVALGDGVTIGANCVIANASIAAGAVIHPFTHMDGEKVGVKIGEKALVGPFARLRPGADLGPRCTWATSWKSRARRWGAGPRPTTWPTWAIRWWASASTTAPVRSLPTTMAPTSTGTVIEDDVHVGSNCVLVAPVTIGRGGTVGRLDDHQGHAAGCAVGRARQAGQHRQLAAAAKKPQVARNRLRVRRCRRSSGTLGSNFGAVHRKEGLHVAHVGVAREQPLRQREVARHVRARGRSG